MKQVIAGDQLVASGLFQTQEFLDAEFSGFRTQLLHELYIRDNGVGRIRMIRGYKGHDWASARLTGKDRFHYRQGIFKARLKLPWETGAHGSMWEDSSQIPAYNALSGIKQERAWAFWPERDIFESNKDGVKGGMSNGILCTPVIDKPAHDLSMKFTMQQFGADPDAFNDWAMESDDESWRCYLNGQQYRKIERSKLNKHRQDTWNSWKFPLFAVVPSRWAGNPNNGNYANGVDLVIEKVEFDMPPRLVAFPANGSQVPHPEPTPEPTPVPTPTPIPQPETPMDITFKAAADEAARPTEWHLFWTLEGAPRKDVKLYLFNGLKSRNFATTGLAHVWVPKTWENFVYWLEGGGVKTDTKNATLPKPTPTDPPTNNKADLAAALAYTRALATNLRHNADQADLMVGILENVVERLP